MVYSKLLFVALGGGFSLWKGHDTCVVQQNVEFFILLIEFLGELLYRVQVIEIHGHKFNNITKSRFNFDSIYSVESPGLISASENHGFWSELDHFDGCRITYASVGTCNQNDFAFETGRILIVATVKENLKYHQ